jgi:methyl-accepting chemotaxis protein
MMKFSIRMKMLTGFLAVAVVLIISGSFLFNSLSKMDKSSQELLNHKVDILLNASNITKIAVQQSSALRDYLLTQTEESLNRLNQANQTQSQQLKTTAQLELREEDKQSITKLQNLSKDFQTKADKVVSLAKTDRQASIELASTTVIPVGREMEYEAERMVKAQQQLLNEGNKANSDMADQLKLINLITIIATSILAMVIGYFVSILIAKPILRISKSAQQIADGDLTGANIVIKNKDEVGDLADSFNQMKSNLQRLISEIQAGAEHVASSSEELAAGAVQTNQATEQISSSIQKVAEGTEHQVQSVMACVQAVNEMSAGVQQIAVNAQNVTDVVIATADRSLEGNHAIQSAVQQMQSINNTMEDLTRVITGLGERSKDIGKIVELITAIAKQTNLLALNAAIESARAGEHGRGFAVVANEVRNLAEQSSQSAQQIAELITTIQQEAKSSVVSVETGRAEVSEGIRIVNQAGETFEHIHRSINHVSDEIQNVSASVEQMSANTEQVVAAITSISETSEEAVAESQTVSAATQEQLASMAEISSAVASLSTMAEQLQGQIGKFKV